MWDQITIIMTNYTREFEKKNTLTRFQTDAELEMYLHHAP